MIITELKSILQENFSNLSKNRLNFLSMFIKVLLIHKRVNLSFLAPYFSSTAKISSNYRRMQRFFLEFRFNEHELAEFVLKNNPNKNYVLLLDRTEWKFGKSVINILMLSISYKGYSLPLMWDFLPNRGNSSSYERAFLLRRFVKKFGSGKIKYLLADREFIGESWFKFLLENKIHFKIRVRSNFLIKSNNTRITLKRKFSYLNRIGLFDYLNNVRLLNHNNLTIFAKRVSAKEYLFIISDLPHGKFDEEYSERWQIETMFGDFKKKGFNLEETHMSDQKKLNTLIAIISIAYIWIIKTGTQELRKNNIKPKRYQKKVYLIKSVFKTGLEIISRAIYFYEEDITSKQELFQIAKLLSCS